MNFLCQLLLFCLFVIRSVSAENLSDFTSGLIQPPLFEAGSKAYLPSEEIIAKVTPILQSHLVDTNYDRVGVAMQLIDYYQNRMCSLSEIKRFEYNTRLRKGRGGACVSLTLDILSKIPTELNAYVVAAVLPKKYHQFAAPLFCHTAVLIAFENPKESNDQGYVLLDPSFDFSEPIVLYRNGANYSCDGGGEGIWVFAIDRDMITCQIHPQELSDSLTEEESNRLHMIYRTDRLINPVESSALPMALIDRRLSLLARESNGTHTAHLNIELDKGQIVWAMHETRRLPISFDHFFKGDFVFDEPFASCLGMSADELHANILYVLQNKHILDELYIQYLELIQKIGDFSIVGNIDLIKLRAIIDRYTETTSS
jgi:hypothetical protein